MRLLVLSSLVASSRSTVTVTEGPVVNHQKTMKKKRRRRGKGGGEKAVTSANKVRTIWIDNC